MPAYDWQAAAAALDLFDALAPCTSPRARRLCAIRSALACTLDALLLVGSRWLRGANLSPHFSYVDNPIPSISEPSVTLTSMRVTKDY